MLLPICFYKKLARKEVLCLWLGVRVRVSVTLSSIGRGRSLLLSAAL